jgi:hypothetical protein
MPKTASRGRDAGTARITAAGVATVPRRSAASQGCRMPGSVTVADLTSLPEGHCDAKNPMSSR